MVERLPVEGHGHNLFAFIDEALVNPDSLRS